MVLLMRPNPVAGFGQLGFAVRSVPRDRDAAALTPLAASGADHAPARAGEQSPPEVVLALAIAHRPVAEAHGDLGEPSGHELAVRCLLLVGWRRGGLDLGAVRPIGRLDPNAAPGRRTRTRLLVLLVRVECVGFSHGSF